MDWAKVEIKTKTVSTSLSSQQSKSLPIPKPSLNGAQPVLLVEAQCALLSARASERKTWTIQ